MLNVKCLVKGVIHNLVTSGENKINAKEAYFDKLEHLYTGCAFCAVLPTVFSMWESSTPSAVLSPSCRGRSYTQAML